MNIEYIVIEGEYKNEKEFQKDYIKALKDWGYRVYKLPDVGYTLKPCDILALYKGTFIGMELKYGRVNTYERIYKKLRPNQIGSLQKIKESGGISLVIGYDDKEKKMYIYMFELLDISSTEL